jgi:hypothetical protein
MAVFDFLAHPTILIGYLARRFFKIIAKLEAPAGIYPAGAAWVDPAADYHAPPPLPQQEDAQATGQRLRNLVNILYPLQFIMIRYFPMRKNVGWKSYQSIGFALSYSRCDV